MQVLRSPAALVVALVLAALCVVAPAASAAPVTVEFRIEGKEATHFDGTVTTDIRPVDGHDGTGSHTCDGTNAPQGGSPAPTAGTALADASQRGPFSFLARYSPGADDFFLETVNGETPDFNADGTFWMFMINGNFASAGMCHVRVQPGDRVLFARGTGSETVLQLSGPATAPVGEPATYTVTDLASGAPVAGADVAGQTTGADGRATLTFGSAGTRTIKATRANAIRSNAVSTCVHAGNDGTCGTGGPGAGGAAPAAGETPFVFAPTSTILGLRSGQRFSGRGAPRLLRGRIALGSRPLDSVQLRLRRVADGRCRFWSVKAEKWRRRPCRTGAFFYEVGDRTEWSYLMPARLPAGRYDLHAKAVDRSGLSHDAYVMFRVARRGR